MFGPPSQQNQNWAPQFRPRPPAQNSHILPNAFPGTVGHALGQNPPQNSQHHNPYQYSQQQSSGFNQYQVRQPNSNMQTAANQFVQFPIGSQFVSNQFQNVSANSFSASQAQFGRQHVSAQNGGFSVSASSNVSLGNNMHQPLPYQTYQSYPEKSSFAPNSVYSAQPGMLSGQQQSGNVINVQQQQQLAVGYPSWTRQLNRLPPIYRDVLRYAAVPDGQHLDTPKLYTVLMTSQLSKPALGHLWSLVNKETVGVLNLQESVMLLALVALVQNNKISLAGLNNISFLHQLQLDPAFPNPNLSIPPTLKDNFTAHVQNVIKQKTPNTLQTQSFEGSSISMQQNSVQVRRGVESKSEASGGWAGFASEPNNDEGFSSTDGRSEHSHNCSCMESSCDDDGGGVPRGTVGAEGDELEEDGGVVYIAEDILYSGSEDCSAADSYQSSSCSSPAQLASNNNSPKHTFTTGPQTQHTSIGQQQQQTNTYPVHNSIHKHQTQQQSIPRSTAPTLNNMSVKQTLQWGGGGSSKSSVQNYGHHAEQKANDGQQKINVSNATAALTTASSKGKGQIDAFPNPTGDEFGDFADFETAMAEPITANLSSGPVSGDDSSPTVSIKPIVSLSGMAKPASPAIPVIDLKNIMGASSPRNRTISSSSTLSSQSIKIPSLSSPKLVSPWVTLPINVIKAEQIRSNHSNDYESKENKDSWFQKFQQIEPERKRSEGVDDDFDDFQDFTEAPSLNLETNSSGPEKNIKKPSYDNQPEVHKGKPIESESKNSTNDTADKYAVFRDMLVAETSEKALIVSTDEPKDVTPEVAEKEILSTNGMLDIEDKSQENINDDFADFKSFPNSTNKAISLKSETVSHSVSLQMHETNISPAFQPFESFNAPQALDSSDWANFESSVESKNTPEVSLNFEKEVTMSENRPGLEAIQGSQKVENDDIFMADNVANLDNSNRLDFNQEKETNSDEYQTEIDQKESTAVHETEAAVSENGIDAENEPKKVEDDWADFDSFTPRSDEKRGSTVEKTTNDHSEKIESAEFEEKLAAENDEWTEFGSDSANEAGRPDVSGLIWAKQQVSADGLYDRIKQTILAEDVKRPKIRPKSAEMTQKVESKTNFSSDSSQNGPLGSKKNSDAAVKNDKQQGGTLATERYISLNEDFEFSDGTRQKKVWEQLLTQCETVLKTAFETIEETSRGSSSLKDEVLNSNEWMAFCTGACLVYGVSLKVKRSFESFKLYDESLKELIRAIEERWVQIQQYIPEEVSKSSMFVASTSECELPPVAQFGAEACGVCLLQIDDPSKPQQQPSSHNTNHLKHSDERSRPFNDNNPSLHCISFGGRIYHAPCANLWVNKVDLVLPSLLLVDVL